MVADGNNVNTGCCFDYGQTESNSIDTGAGSMDALYFGTATTWGYGPGPGPWVMVDQENNIFSGAVARFNANDPTIPYRFVTALSNSGGGNRWTISAADAQQGALTTYYDGVRPSGYWPAKREGGIGLGNGGDNSNGSRGTFYEGVMTTGFPSDETTDAVQANIVAAKYQSANTAVSVPQPTFTTGQTQTAAVTFTNTTGQTLSGLALSLTAPTGWTVYRVGHVRLGRARRERAGDVQRALGHGDRQRHADRQGRVERRRRRVDREREGHAGDQDQRGPHRHQQRLDRSVRRALQRGHDGRRPLQLGL